MKKILSFHQRKILDPEGSFLQKWNQIFVLYCVVAVSFDPLFFYIPMINGKEKCLDLDKKLNIAACALRSFIDIFYLLHILFQFRTGFIAPYSRVFGRGDLIEDFYAIAKRYLSSYFIIDILSILPFPQKYLQPMTARIEEMRVKRRDSEQWMAYRMLPEKMRKRIRRYEEYKWDRSRGVDEESLVCSFPKDIRRDIKRHLYWDLIKTVPMLNGMDEKLMDALCDRLRPALYTENSFIVREGEYIDEMLFVIRGNLLSENAIDGRTNFSPFSNISHLPNFCRVSILLKAREFCGDELLTWALAPNPSRLPISTRNVRALTDVEAFAIMADDLKVVVSEFRHLLGNEVRHIFRYHSPQWRTWAACFIQASWRRYRRRKLEKSLCDAENKLQVTLAEEAGTSSSFGVGLFVSKFATRALGALRWDHSGNSPRRLPV